MVWKIDSEQRISKLVKGNWLPVDGLLSEISVGVKNVWGVNWLDNIWYDSGRFRWNRVQGELRQVSRNNCTISKLKLKSIFIIGVR